MLEWIIGAAVVGTIAYLARGSLSSSSTPAPTTAPGPQPTSAPSDGGPVFAMDTSSFVDCKAVVQKWIATLGAADQAAIAKAISEGDVTVLESAASYFDGANPALAKCIRAMKPKIISSTPVLTSTYAPLNSPLNPAAAAFKVPLTSGQLLAALNTCMAGSGMPADLQNHVIEVFNAEPTRAKLTLIADALRPVYPAVASCINKIPA